MSRTFGAATSDRVDCGSPAVLDTLDPYTLVCWLYPTSWTSPRRVITKGISENNSRRINLRCTATQGTLQVGHDRATTDLTYTSGAEVTPLSQWWFLGYSFNSGGAANDLVRLYKGSLTTAVVQLTLGNTDGAGAFNSDAAESFIIGNSSNNAEAWQGNIAYVSIWNAQLTLAQIDRLRVCTDHLSLASELGATCLGAWRLSELESAPDSSGNANDGTITGATAAVDPPLLTMRRKRRRAA